MTGQRPKRVLHITESFGGGVATAVEGYAQASPEYEHFLLCHIRRDSFSYEDDLSVFRELFVLPGNAFSAYSQIRALVRSVEPDVVHVHSSIAGLVARMALPRFPGRTMVYTPHCYAFERRDKSRPWRAAVWLIEWSLAWRTDVLAGCSRWETARGPSVRPGIGRVRLPQVTVSPILAAGPAPLRIPASPPVAVPRIVMNGRICPQKDPRFFIDLVRRLRGRNTEFDAVWIGDGDPDLRRELVSEGVRVTGWLSRDESLAAMDQATVYLHTAAWEGYPLSVLEAVERGLPVVARRVRCFGHLSTRVAPSGAAELAAEVGALLLDDSGDRVAANRSEWAQESESHRKADLPPALAYAYSGRATSRPGSLEGAGRLPDPPTGL